MEKKIDEDLKREQAMMLKAINNTYKKPFHERVAEVVGQFFLSILLLILFILIVAGIVYVLITLIENPVSLAILCATIILLFFWGWRR